MGVVQEIDIEEEKLEEFLTHQNEEKIVEYFSFEKIVDDKYDADFMIDIFYQNHEDSFKVLFNTYLYTLNKEHSNTVEDVTYKMFSFDKNKTKDEDIISAINLLFEDIFAFFEKALLNNSVDI